MKRIFFIAIVLRIVLLPLTYHSDINNNTIWGIYAQEFGLEGFYDFLNFGNYARPDYPPLAIPLFVLVKYIYDAVFFVLWKINVLIPAFPSLIIVWLRDSGYQTFLKIPGVLADMGIGYVIFVWAKEKAGAKKAKRLVSMYLFNPAVIYLSAIWGQLDSIATFFALLVLFSLNKKRPINASLAFVTSIMIKATFVPLALIGLLWALTTKLSLKQIVLSIFGSLILVYLINDPFTTLNPLVWITDKYIKIFIVGASILPFINLNAYNFWGLILGLERVSVYKTIVGVELGTIAYLIGGVFVLVCSYLYIKKRLPLVIYTLMTYFSIFLFFPRIHERYLFPVIALFPFFYLFSYNTKKLKRIYIILTITFFLNLYHWWWYPPISPVIAILENNLVERLISLVNIVVYFYTLRLVITTKPRSIASSPTNKRE